ncbi:MAG: general stress protein [Peptococcaceae bacterium]|nr:general stress protein [Peptococcaceae bacterium]
MSKTVIATFNNRDSAERAVNDLRSKGFERDISLLAKDEKIGRGDANKYNTNFTGGDPVMNGVSTGGTIGGLIGLAAGAGALAIPGIGPLVAAGPIAGLLSGAATGGIAGGLADYGIPADRGRFFEERIRQGDILVAVRCEDNKAEEASRILSRHGGSDVEIH